MSFADPLAALITYLQSDAGVAALAGNRVFGELLPATEASQMPRAAVVIKSYGGTDKATINIQFPDFVFRTYGATGYEAYQLHLAITSAMRGLGRTVIGNTLLHEALKQTGPFYGRDDETYWEYYYSTWSVGADYREVI